MKKTATLFTVALLLNACTSTNEYGEVQPLAQTPYVEFHQVDEGASEYGPFLAATLAQHNEDFAVSASYYLQALNADPESRFVADRAFLQLLYAGRLDDAASVAVKLAQTDSAEADDLTLLLNVMEAFHRKDWQTVDQRLRDNPLSGFGGLIAPLIEAWGLVARGQVTEALALMEPLRLDRQLASVAEEQVTYMLDYAGEAEKAEEAYRALIEAQSPTSLQPYVAYAYFMMRQGRREEAYAFMGAQARRFNNNTYLIREGTQIAAGLRPSQVMASPNGAIGGMFFRLASEFSQGRNLNAAVIYLRLASYLTPEVPDIYFMLGNVLDTMENHRAAASVYASVPGRGGFGRAAEARRIAALQRAGEVENAEAALRNALRDNPMDIDFRIALGDLVRGRGDLDEAILHYSTAIERQKTLSSEDWYSYFARGVSYEQKKDWPTAELDLRKALSLNPEEPTILNYLGYSWIDRGLHVEEAKGMIEKAVEMRPEDGFITDSLGWVYFLTGDYQKAVETLEKAVRLEPDDVTINEHLGDAYWKVGRRIEARFQWQHALDSAPDAKQTAALEQKMLNGLPAGA